MIYFLIFMFLSLSLALSLKKTKQKKHNNVPNHSKTDEISLIVPEDEASPCSGLVQPIPTRFSLELM